MNHSRGYARVRQTVLILLDAPLGLTKHVALFQRLWWSVTARRPRSCTQFPCGSAGFPERHRLSQEPRRAESHGGAVLEGLGWAQGGKGAVFLG